jgi:photosystem II stability/assembly factor-like uncharacterized protein
MIKLNFLIICLGIISTFCDSQVVKVKDSKESNVHSITNKDAETYLASDIDWRNMSRFLCSSSVGKNKKWLVTAQDYRLLATNDGGITWSVNRGEKTTLCVFFIDENHGWLIDTENFLWVTQDGGKNWSKKSRTELVFGANLQFFDLSNGWIADGVKLFYTNDGGNSWNQVLGYKEKYLKGYIKDVFFSNANSGWACDGGDMGGMIYKTTNSGKRWSAKKLGKAKPLKCNIFFTDSNTGWYGSDWRNFYYTDDGGETWSEYLSLPENLYINSMFWLSVNEGWIVGAFLKNEDLEPRLGKGAVLHTTNGGKNWIKVGVSESVPFFDSISFSDSQNGWLISHDSIYITSDGGESWVNSLSLSALKN